MREYERDHIEELICLAPYIFGITSTSTPEAASFW